MDIQAGIRTPQSAFLCYQRAKGAALLPAHVLVRFASKTDLVVAAYSSSYHPTLLNFIPQLNEITR